MYVPGHFDQAGIDAIHELVSANPLGALVTAGVTGLSANHIPFELASEPKPYGALFGHVARANPVWREGPDSSQVLVLFQGVNTYVSPSWYPSKKTHGKVVPTWNYVVAHVHGRLRAIHSASWVRAHVERLTGREESGFAQPWSVADAPSEFIEKMLNAIVGIRIDITKLEGKWKVSQNRPRADREGVAEALRTQGTANARQMAEYIEGAKR